MTPLHILAFSMKHNLDMYQLVVEHIPGDFVSKDEWQGVPL
jgi:hypothetical protein